MQRIPFFNNVMVLPACTLTSTCIDRMAVFSARLNTAGWETKHQAFAAGFFGFHYIRAVIDDDFMLRQDALSRLTEALGYLHLSGKYLHALELCVKPSYSEFNASFIEAVRQELGDVFSADVMWMISFGYESAATASCLAGAEQCRSKTEMSTVLRRLEAGSPKLLGLARRGDVSDKIIHSLRQYRSLLSSLKTRKNLHRCRMLVGSVVRDLLVTTAAKEVLSQ